jgi:hypothetical protein
MCIKAWNTPTIIDYEISGNSSVGRALVSQTKGRGSESRFPLKIRLHLKHILPFLFIITIIACTRPASTPKALFKEELTRNEDTVILRKIVNNRQIEIYSITDSILLLSQVGEKTDTIHFNNYFHSFNCDVDLNGDNNKDLMIYSFPNMHGQLRPYVFLSNHEGKLYYRPELDIYNLSYDTVSRNICGFYVGGVYSESSKDIYKWENDSLRLVRGASMQYISADKSYIVKFYEKDVTKPYQTISRCSKNLWDTAVFENYPDIHEIIEL